MVNSCNIEKKENTGEYNNTIHQLGFLQFDKNIQIERIHKTKAPPPPPTLSEKYIKGSERVISRDPPCKDSRFTTCIPLFLINNVEDTVVFSRFKVFISDNSPVFFSSRKA